MPSKIVQARNVRNNFCVLVSTSDELVTLLNLLHGTSAADPEYLRNVQIRLLPATYTFTAAQLPLKIRSDMSLIGAGSEQTILTSAQAGLGTKNVIECKDLWSNGSGSAGRCFNVTLAGFSIVGDAYAPAAIYCKGLNNSHLRDIHIRDMTASGSIGIQLDAEFGFGCYYNHLQSIDVGWPGVGTGCGIGIRFKTTDLATQPKRCNSNSLSMCSIKWCVDAGYEINGGAGNTFTACEAEVNAVGLRVLSGVTTVVSGGYFENNTTGDIQLGSLSGDPEASQQTVLIQPQLSSTTRLVGQSLGSTGDVYLLSEDTTSPSATGYDGNWIDKAYIGSLAASYADFSAYASATRVNYYKLSGDSTYRHEVYNDGKMTWGDGSAAVDITLYREAANVLALAQNDSFRLNGGSAWLTWASTTPGAADIALFRLGANLLSLANDDSFQINGAGALYFSTASATTADVGLKWMTATNCGTLTAIDDCDIRVQGGYNTGRFRLGTNYLWVDGSNNLRFHTSEPAADGDGTNLLAAASGSVATDAIWDAAGDLAVGTGSNTAAKLTMGIPGQALHVNAGATGLEWATISGGGDALVSNPLSQFASTTSAQLAGVISDETGSGALVFATSPTLVTPALGVASATTINKVALTAPATGSTLTIADGFTLTVNGSATITNGTHSGTNTGDQTLNGLSSASDYTIAVGTTGTDVNVASSGSTVTVHVPDASATARGVLTTGTQTIAGQKTFGSMSITALSDLVMVDSTPFATQTNYQHIWRNTAGAPIGWIDSVGRPVFGQSSFTVSSTFHATMWSGGAFGWTTGPLTGTSAIDTAMYRDGAAGTVGVRSGTTAHSLRVYNTWTSSTNYERGVFDWVTTANTLRIGTEKGSGGGTARSLVFVTDATVAMTISTTGLVSYPTTVTTGGTTGNQTINKLTGTVNIAAAGTTVTVTNSLVSANSIVLCVLRTNDTTASIMNVVPAAGSFVINLAAAATAEVSIGFLVVN